MMRKKQNGTCVIAEKPKKIPANVRFELKR